MSAASTPAAPGAAPGAAAASALPLHERLEMARLFLELDVDGSNSISAAEMAAATSRFGGQLTPAQMQKLAEKLALMDADGDKTVSFAEFMSALTALSLHRREKQAMLVGKVMEQLQKRLAGGDKERASADDIRAACRDAGHGSIDIGVLSPADVKPASGYLDYLCAVAVKRVPVLGFNGATLTKAEVQAALEAADPPTLAGDLVLSKVLDHVHRDGDKHGAFGVPETKGEPGIFGKMTDGAGGFVTGGATAVGDGVKSVSGFFMTLATCGQRRECGSGSTGSPAAAAPAAPAAAPAAAAATPAVVIKQAVDVPSKAPQAATAVAGAI